MALYTGNKAPDFSANTTLGAIDFHDWFGGGRVILLSHHRDFTPVCTTEQGCMASLKPEFDQRNTRVIRLSVDTVVDHVK